MATRARSRDIEFAVIDGYLERTVAFPADPQRRPYTHRCSRAVYEAVARAIEEQAADGVTLDPLARGLDLPFTQVGVALEFLKERGCVVTRRRRNYPASDFLFEDAMIEYLYLAERPNAGDAR